MSEIFAYHQGDSPLLISVPHDGRELPDEQRTRMTDAGLDLPDTDWHVGTLYGVAGELGASMIVARYSRYVVDLNRSPSGAALYERQVVTGLCPQYTFAGDAIYLEDVPVSAAETAERVDRFWRPYHERLAAALDDLRCLHGYALLWDAHSIASSVPRLFEGVLPVLNLGTFDDRSCDTRIAGRLLRIARESPYDAVLNGRFKGGYITRHYGNATGDVQAVQLEIAQRAYMDEASRAYDTSRAEELWQTLRLLLSAYVEEAAVQ